MKDNFDIYFTELSKFCFLTLLQIHPADKDTVYSSCGPFGPLDFVLCASGTRPCDLGPPSI